LSPLVICRPDPHRLHLCYFLLHDTSTTQIYTLSLTTLFRSPEYEKLMAISDLIYQKNLELFEAIFDKEKFNKINAELQSIIINRSEEHTSELQSRFDLVCRLLLEKKKKTHTTYNNTHEL